MRCHPRHELTEIITFGGLRASDRSVTLGGGVLSGHAVIERGAFGPRFGNAFNAESTMYAILNLQKLAGPSADAREGPDDSPLISDVSIHCSGVQNSTQSYYCTQLGLG